MADRNELSFGMLSLVSEKNNYCLVTRMNVATGVTATLIQAESSFGYAKPMISTNIMVSANPIDKIQTVKFYLSYKEQIKSHEFNYLKLTYITSTNYFYTIYYSDFATRPIITGTKMARTISAGNRAVPVFGAPQTVVNVGVAAPTPVFTPTAPATPFVLSPDANIAYIRYDGADKMGKALRSQYPELFEGCYDPEKAMKFIMEKVFPDKTRLP